MQFHEWLQATMADEELTQADLKHRTGANSGLVSAWYRGLKLPSTKYVPKIAEALGRTEQQVWSAIAGRDTSVGANLDARTKATISRVFGLPADFSDEEAELVRDLAFVVRRWQEKMARRDSVQAAQSAGPRPLEEGPDREASGASR